MKKKLNIQDPKVHFWGFQKRIFGILVNICNRNFVLLAFFDNDNIFFDSEEKSNIEDAKMHPPQGVRRLYNITHKANH